MVRKSAPWSRFLEATLQVATSTEAGVTELDFDVVQRFGATF